MVTASQRRRAVNHLKSRRISERRACRLVRFSRSAAWYRLQGRNDGALRERLKQLAQDYPRYGCPTLHGMLVTEGRVVNFKRTYRVYREEGLQVRRKRRKKLNIPRIPMLVPSTVNERWSVDFVSDQLANGRRFRVFNVVDGSRASACCRSSTSRSRASALRTSWSVSRAADGYRRRSSVTTDPSSLRRRCSCGRSGAA